MKKHLKIGALAIIIAAAINLLLWFPATMKTDAVAPVVPKGAWLIVSRLGPIDRGDVVMFRDSRSHRTLGIAEAVTDNVVVVSRTGDNGPTVLSIAPRSIIGRVILNTRP